MNWFFLDKVYEWEISFYFADTSTTFVTLSLSGLFNPNIHMQKTFFSLDHWIAFSLIKNFFFSVLNVFDGKN